MAAFPHGRQVFLFLIAVLFPSTVLVGLGLRIIRQERELAATRLADDRRRLVAELRQGLTAELEAVRLMEQRSALNRGAGLAPRPYQHPATQLVASIANDRVVLPWETDERLPRARASLSQPAFARAIARGERAELADRNLDRAIAAYRDAATTATDRLQTAYARLLLARALKDAGKEAEAADLYRMLLRLPSEVVDEHGIALGLYAAAPLLASDRDRSLVRDRLNSELTSARWPTPPAAHLLLDLLRQAGTDPAHGAPATVGRAEQEIALLERGADLQRAFPTLGLRYGGLGSPGASPAWVLFANGEWLVSVAPLPARDAEWLIAVATKPILAAVRESDHLSEAARAGVAFRMGDEAPGDPLGSSFPELKVTFSEAPELALLRVNGLQRSLSFAALALVLGIALFGAYLLWRDVRREVQLADLRSHFVSSVSHELRTPLTAIRMFAETLRARLDAPAALQADYLDTIVGESERLTRLLNNVLDHAKIEQERKIYRREPTSLSAVIRRAATAMEYPLKQGGFQLCIGEAEDVPLLTVDADAVEQAVLNLLTNAMKYSGNSRVIAVHLRVADGHAVIEVTDRGVGIPEKEQRRLTEKFYRVPSPDNARIPGTGLGLTLVDHMVRAHGGRLGLVSEVGKGSVFSIHLPLDGAS